MKSVVLLRFGRMLSLVLLAGCFGRFNTSACVAADGQTMITAFNNAFYFTASGNRGYFRNTTDGGTTWFWGRANQMEMLIDLYEQTSNPVFPDSAYEADVVKKHEIVAGDVGAVILIHEPDGVPVTHIKRRVCGGDRLIGGDESIVHGRAPAVRGEVVRWPGGNQI